MSSPRSATPRQIVAFVLIAAAIVLAITGPADSAAQARADALFRRALVTFATARALDAVISAAQGTEIALQPVGLGVTLSPGEILDPLNDLVEQFATIVLLAATSLGIQSVGLRISAWWGVTLVLVGAAAFWGWTRWGTGPPAWAPTARRLLMIALLVRFVLPAVTLASGWIFDAFLAAEQEASLEILERTTGEVDELAEVGAAPDPADAEATAGWSERVRVWFGERFTVAGVQARVEAFRDQIGAAVESIVRLIVVFVLQTLVLPLVLLWAAVRLVGARLG